MMKSQFVTFGGTRLAVSPVFDAFWHFAAARQEIFLRRLAGQRSPWTTDPILREHKFTNVYRASDRVSQFLIRHVIYNGEQSAEEVVFRTLLFKLFNSIDTWRQLIDELGEVRWQTFDLRRYARVLSKRAGEGKTLYSAAYIIPPPPFKGERKYDRHLEFLRFMMKDGVTKKVERAKTLQGVFELLSSYPSLGPFLAFQFTIDLNYSAFVNFSEMDYVVAGPGARNGIRKCFPSTGLPPEKIIQLMAESAPDQFAKLGISFSGLWGRSLQLIDVQNLFCEVDKYARVAYPDVAGESNRTRIKQKFSRNNEPLEQWYPPKWHLKPLPVIAVDPLIGVKNDQPDQRSFDLH